MTVYLIMTVVSCFFAFMAAKNYTANFDISVPSIKLKLKLSKPIVYLILAAIPLVLVSGLRWKTGVDHMNYYYVFTNILYKLDTHVEIGFKLLCKLILLFTEDMSVMFFICALITVSFTIAAIKMNSTNLFISVFLYISMGFFYYSMNSIRHFMALSIYMFAYYFLRKRKIIPYIIAILLAATFQKVALVALPLYFLLNIKYKPYWYGIFGSILLAMTIFHRQMLDFIYRFVFDFYKAYEAETIETSYVNIAITLALSLLAFIYQKKLLEKDERNIILINSAYFGLLFFTLCSWIPVYTRIGQYLTILAVFLIPQIIDCEERPMVKRIYTIGLFVGFTAFMLLILYNAKNPLIALNPYHSIFSR